MFDILYTFAYFVPIITYTYIKLLLLVLLRICPYEKFVLHNLSRQKCMVITNQK